MRLVAAGYGLAKLPHVLLRWRHHPGQLTFRDPRCSREHFLALKAPHVARLVAKRGRPLTIWGAGRTGKHLARALERHGVRASCFIDIDPAKIGRLARGAPVLAPDALGASPLLPGKHQLLVAVGARGARALIRAHLTRYGYREGDHFVCAA